MHKTDYLVKCLETLHSPPFPLIFLGATGINFFSISLDPQFHQSRHPPSIRPPTLRLRSLLWPPQTVFLINVDRNLCLVLRQQLLFLLSGSVYQAPFGSSPGSPWVIARLTKSAPRGQRPSARMD